MYYMLHKLETGVVLHCTVLYCNSPGLQPSNTAAPAAPLDTVEPGWPSHRLQAPGYLLPIYCLHIYCLSTAYRADIPCLHTAHSSAGAWGLTPSNHNLTLTRPRAAETCDSQDCPPSSYPLPMSHCPPPIISPGDESVFW